MLRCELPHQAWLFPAHTAMRRVPTADSEKPSFAPRATWTLLSLLVLLPMTLFERTREAGASGLMMASVVFGASLWLWSLVFTYEIWGGIAVFIGLFLFGVGIVPVAMLAALVNGLWSILGQLFLGLVLTFGTRFLAAWIAAREDARRHRF